MNARVHVSAKSEEDALVVPASAVYKSEEAGDFVMLAGSDKKAHLTKIKVGIKTKELAQIESGVKENDSVITVGGYALPDGTQISIEATPAPEPEKGGAADDKDGKDKGGDKDGKDKGGDKGGKDKDDDEKSGGDSKPAKGKE